ACDLRDPGERQQLAAIAAVRGHGHEAAAECRHDRDVVEYEVVLLAALRDRTEECPCRRLCPPEWRRTAGRRPGELLLVLSHGHPAETLAVGLGPGVVAHEDEPATRRSTGMADGAVAVRRGRRCRSALRRLGPLLQLRDAVDAPVDRDTQPGAQRRLDVAHDLLRMESGLCEDVDRGDAPIPVGGYTRRGNPLERAEEALDLLLSQRAGSD